MRRQYYIVANFDKKEKLLPSDYVRNTRLMDFAYTNSPVVIALMNLLATDWKGDHVAVIGSYADEWDEEKCWTNAYKKLAGSCGYYNRPGDEHLEKLYHFTDCVFARVLPDPLRRRRSSYKFDDDSFAETKGCTTDKGWRFIYNHATRQCIDLEKLNSEYFYLDEKTGKLEFLCISPLLLLLTMGSGRIEGEDYCRAYSDYNLVGSWCDTVTAIEVTFDQIPGCEGYREFIPNFTTILPLPNFGHPIPYTEREAMLAKWAKEHKDDKD